MRFNRRRGKLASRKAKIASRIKAKYLNKARNASRIKAKYLNKARVTSRIKATYMHFRRFGMKRSGPFLQICKGECKLKPSNSNTDQMDVDRATTINFQEDIIMEILSRLPVRSLLQFKCVSKFWNTLISDPYFKRIHLKRAKNDRNFQKFLFYHWSQKDNIYSCYCCPLSPIQIIKDPQGVDRPLSAKRFFRIQCCFDGLVVVKVSDTINDKRPILLLWNPSTKESIELPSVELEMQRGSLNLFGFGYDSTSDDYKILKISATFIRDHWESSGEILSLKGGLWRKIDKHHNGICSRLDYMHALAFVQGAFHWIGMSRNFSIISFSISSEVYTEIALPEEILRRVGGIAPSVSALDGMLCACASSIGQVNRTFKLWVMKEYGVKDCWNALISVQDSSIFVIMPKYRFADGEVMFWCSSFLNGEHAFRTPTGPFIDWQRGGFLNGLAFTESLISPNFLVSCL